MRKHLFIVLVAACSSSSNKAGPIDSALNPVDTNVAQHDAPPVPDAAPGQYDFSCLGQPLPTTANPTVSLSGTARKLNGTTLAAAPGVTIKAYAAGSSTVLDTQTTDAAGKFATKAISTNSVPLNGYLIASFAGNMDTYIYPPTPLTKDQANVPVLTLDTGTFGLVAAILGATQSASNGAIGIAVFDCNDKVISGASVTVQHNGQNVGTIKDASAISQAAGGGFIAFDVPPGDVVVAAQYGSMTFLAHSVTSFGGAITTTGVRPGP